VSVLSRVFQIQRGEGRIVGVVVGCMFLTIAGFTIGESGTSALFFDRVGPDALPAMYIAQGGVGLVAMLVVSGSLGRFDRRRAYVWMPLLLVGVVAIERALVSADPTWIYPVLYLTMTVATLVQSVYLWGVAGLVTDTRRAKRLFPIFSAGNILGAVVGGLATKSLASAFGAENLLVVWGLSLLGSAGLCAVIVGVRRGDTRPRARSRRASAIGEVIRGFRFVRRSPLLVWMSIGSVLFSVLFFSLYLPFAQAATDRFADPDALAGFLGVFWASVTAAAFLVSVLLTNRLLGWIGASATLIVLPVLYGGAFATLFVTSTFATLVAVRFGVNLWLQGVSSPAWETLTNVTPEDRRDQVRAFLNGGPAQFGTAIAGVIAIVGQDILTTPQLSMIGFAAAVVMIFVMVMMRRSYAPALVDAIRAGRPSLFDAPVRNAPFEVRGDAQAVGLATSALEDPDPRVRRLAAHLVATLDDERATDALVRASGDVDASVRSTAVAALGQRGRADVVERALADEDRGVRLAAVERIEPARTPHALLEDEDAAVAATAAANLLITGDDDARSRIEQLLASDDPIIRATVFRSLAHAPSGAIGSLAAPRIRPDEPIAVRVAALEALRRADRSIAVPAALTSLEDGDPDVVDAAVATIDAVSDHGRRAHETAEIARIVEAHAAAAVGDASLARGVGTDDEARALLSDALRSRARRNALVALSAATITTPDRQGMHVALEVLRSGDRAQLANALEAVEVAVGASRARSLLGLWEATEASSAEDPTAVDTAAAHADPFVRACAELVRERDRRGDEPVTRSIASLTPMERVLVLRRIELFSALEPRELERVAAIAEERSFADGDVIGAEGELGDELHIVIDGTVRVVRGGSKIADRADGDVIGEMSLITREPRIASLVADGDVRTVRIGHREFEAIVRERPEIALAVMRLLAQRLAVASGGPTAPR
jgi:HEAT repeat protein